MINNEKIFISVACYRDNEIIETILDGYRKARNKDSLVFGVFVQIADDDLNLSDIPSEVNMRVIKKDYRKARGPAYARAQIYNKLYQDELYYLQIDSHSRFIEDWDIELTEILKSLKVNSVISTYPKGYQKGSDFLYPYKKVNVLKLKKIRNGIPVFTSSLEMLNKPKRNYFWAAGFSFCYGALFKIVPFDPHLKNLFWGEEFLMSLRFYTNNIKIFTPHKNIVYTLWSRNYRHTFWELKSVFGVRFDINGFISFLRLCFISDLNDKKNFDDKVKIEIDKYGIGKRRTIKEYYDKTGIINLIDELDYEKVVNEYFNSLNLSKF